MPGRGNGVKKAQMHQSHKFSSLCAPVHKEAIIVLFVINLTFLPKHSWPWSVGKHYIMSSNVASSSI